MSAPGSRLAVPASHCLCKEALGVSQLGGGATSARRSPLPVILTLLRSDRRCLPSGAAQVSSFSPMERVLLAWFRANGRDLPWRRTHDPYAILDSEVMLQQSL